MMDFVISYIIIDYGNSEKVLKIAKKNDIQNKSILYGSGSIKNSVLEFLEISESKKEIIICIDEKEKIDVFLNLVNKKLNLHKQNHGISFIINISNKEVENMYNAIFVIVDKGKGENVVDIATKYGSKGATILNARGSNSEETKKIFSIEIEPEKEIVLMLVENKYTNNICENLTQELELGKPGKGIIFVQEVSKVYGIEK